MGKVVKKKSRKLFRTVRKTLGTLFLVSALVIAAIPVDGLRAAEENPARAARSAISVKPETNIPQAMSSDKIYTTEDTLLKFVYIPRVRDASGKPSANTSYCAIIVGYDKDVNLEGNSLVIPNEVSAYRQYSVNQGQNASYAAVGRNGNFLFYRSIETEVLTPEAADNLLYNQAPDYNERLEEFQDEEGKTFVRVRGERGEFKVCYLDNKAAWEGIASNNLYYDKSNLNGEGPAANTNASNYNNFSKVGDSQEFARIQNVTVNYISNQYYEGGNSVSGGNAADTGLTWHPVTGDDPSKGVFAGAGNIVDLKLGKDFNGVGDYAFYQCSSLRSMSFENGLSVIGEGAFKECVNLQQASLNVNCLLSAIGAYAFQQCTQLTSFVLPVSVTTIGDLAFESCERLATIDLCSEGSGESGTTSNLLTTLGMDVFKNCKALESITFPDHCPAQVYVSCFEGCTSLKYICARNTTMNFLSEEGYFTYDDFKNMLGESNPVVKGEFYFEGIENSVLHKTCKDNCFAFSYIWDSTQGFGTRDLYELTMKDEEAGGTNTFVVTSKKNLHRYSYTAPVKTLTIPKKIGPHNIETLDANVISNYCNLETVIIPNTVTAIGAGAFQGCHNLTNVMFDSYSLESGQNVEIGQDAFKTQNCTSHNCGGDVETDSNNSPAKKLSFTGPISLDFAPYRYAMSENGRYNNSSQTASYITYYSGWPGNLEIQYNSSTGLSELVNFPSLEELSGYEPSRYKYIELLGEKYVNAMKTAYSTYKTSPNSMTEEQRDVVNAVLDLVIPEGVQSVKEGLIRQKSQGTDPTRTVTAYSLETIAGGEEYTDTDGTLKVKEGTGTFAGCKDLTGIFLKEASDGTGTKTIEKHAFMGCDNLANVDLAPTITEIGICPFYGCEKLSGINFQNNPNFDCVNSIIYGLDGEGKKVKIVECLEGRSMGYVDHEEDELANVAEIAEEAFRGTNVSSVDLTATAIKTVPVRAFAETVNLSRVYLPHTLENLAFQDYAFEGSTVEYFDVASSNSAMRAAPDAFTGLMKKEGASVVPRPQSEYNAVQWYSVPGSQAEDIGVSWGFNPKEHVGITYYDVTFTYWDTETQAYVSTDASEKIPSNEMSKIEEYYPVPIGTVVEIEGNKYRLTEWKENTDASKLDHLYYDAVYKVLRWVVTFQNYNGALITTVEVPDEGSVPEQRRPVPGVDFQGPEGQTFKGWKTDGDLGYITSDLTAVADYSVDGEYLVEYLARKGSITSDWELFYSTTLKEGATAPDLTPSEEWAVEGYKFTGWDKELANISEPTTFYATYEPGSGNGDGDNNGNNPGNPSGTHTLTVVGGNGSGTYATGAQVVISAASPAEGQEFSDWSVSPAETVVADKNRSTTILTMPDQDVAAIANYKAKSSSGNNQGGNTGSGNTTGSSNTSNNLHTLTVKGGSGSGSYAPGEQIIVTADKPAKGQVFSSWTVSPSSTTVTDKTLSSIAVTMPNYDVALIANYKASGSGGSSSSGTGNTASSNTNRPGGSTGTVNKGGNTVIIDKNGFSNTRVVSATVNGSSDNFTIKVTESSEATEAVLRALLAEYGNIDNIKYFPMDISLYDSTGKNKITDTTGLSVSITLPLPDSLITYAGNNKVAGVVNDKLDKLTPRFSTIDGVSCITFTAEHFSPYVIYVDVANLSDGTISDNTPTTGDGIHPKWFLSIGLACLSFVMFMMKDNASVSRKKRKATVKVRG